jgi:hypothetical protein
MATYQGRDVGAMIAARWGEYGFLLVGTLLNGMLLMIPAMFLLGAAAWRSGSSTARPRAPLARDAAGRAAGAGREPAYALTHALVDARSLDAWRRSTWSRSSSAASAAR